MASVLSVSRWQPTLVKCLKMASFFEKLILFAIKVVKNPYLTRTSFIQTHRQVELWYFAVSQSTFVYVSESLQDTRLMLLV